MEKPSHAIQLLSVDDNASDADILRLCFSQVDSRVKFHWVADIPKAIDWLLQRKGYEQAPRPDLILLDLNLPGHDGRELLSLVKGQPDLRRIPVIVLSTSNSDRDIQESYDLGANAYITKPLDLSGFETLVRGIEGFWVSVARLP